jgi:tetratricopeptide (TPR) repeat protein
MLYNGTGEHAQALESARGALELTPSNAQALDVLATARLGLGEREKAIAAYKRAVAHAPESAVGHLHLADAFLANGHLEQAQASYGQALEHDPDQLAALLKSATVLQTLGKHAEAAARAQRAVTLQPEHALAQATCGRTSGISGGRRPNITRRFASIRACATSSTALRISTHGQVGETGRSRRIARSWLATPVR